MVTIIYIKASHSLKNAYHNHIYLILWYYWWRRYIRKNRVMCKSKMLTLTLIYQLMMYRENGVDVMRVITTKEDNNMCVSRKINVQLSVFRVIWITIWILADYFRTKLLYYDESKAIVSPIRRMCPLVLINGRYYICIYNHWWILSSVGSFSCNWLCLTFL